MPGGLEPLDPNVPGSSAGADTSSCDRSGYSYPSWGRWWWRWWPMCPSQETRPSLVRFSWMHLQAGAISLTFKAVAATPGTFVLPPARAFALQQPELLGMSAGGKFRVCPGACSGSVVAAYSAPRSCPKDCSGNGMCNVAKGVCLCNQGFRGNDCGTVVTSGSSATPSPTKAPTKAPTRSPLPPKATPPPPKRTPRPKNKKTPPAAKKA